MAIQAVDEEVPANANIHVRQNAFNQIVEDLRQHEEGQRMRASQELTMGLA